MLLGHLAGQRPGVLPSTVGANSSSSKGGRPSIGSTQTAGARAGLLACALHGVAAPKRKAVKGRGKGSFSGKGRGPGQEGTALPAFQQRHKKVCEVCGTSLLHPSASVDGLSVEPGSNSSARERFEHRRKQWVQMYQTGQLDLESSVKTEADQERLLEEEKRRQEEQLKAELKSLTDSGAVVECLPNLTGKAWEYAVECLLSLGDLAAAREAVLNGRRWVQASENTTMMF
eukprot:symbB.v1.2.030442.t1/scaffold3423.1/size57148/5